VIRVLPALLALRSVCPFFNAAEFALKLRVWIVERMCGFANG
jgi:hypothetical protein